MPENFLLRNRAVRLLTVFVLVALAAPLPVGAVSYSDLQTQQNKANTARQKIADGESNKRLISQEIKEADGRLNTLQGELTKLEQELGRTRQARNTITAELNRLRAELAKTQAQLDEAIAKLKQYTKTLNRRAGNVYKSGDITFLEVLLDATDFADFLTRARFLQQIISTDAKLVTNIKKTKKAIETARAAIEKNRDETQAKEDALSAEVNRLASLTEAQRAKRNEVQAQISSKEQIVAKIDNEKELYLAEAAEAERSAARIKQQLAQLAVGGGRPVVGKSSASGFIWPANGPVSSGFGMRWGRMHNGIDIPVPTGTPVVASKAGRVAIASWYGGYGNLVVVDHGGGVSTWYGHNSAFTAGVGQSVSQGQVIARAGSTGHSTGPHVHYEIRFNGNPVNPLNYLP